MNWNQQYNPLLEIVWKFVRGDMGPTEFEQWVYAETELENQLGGALYQETISADYSGKRAVYEIRKALETYLREASRLQCECLTLPDLADVEMGEASEIALRTFEERARRGPALWWLTAYQCSECAEWWLVAEEGRQNDVYFLKRLSLEEGEEIVKEGRWPNDFDKYETLMRLGSERGHRWTFVDPLDRSLLWTAADLARERPGIRVSELAKLLNVDMHSAQQIAKKASREEGVVINFEQKEK